MVRRLRGSRHIGDIAESFTDGYLVRMGGEAGGFVRVCLFYPIVGFLFGRILVIGLLSFLPHGTLRGAFVVGAVDMVSSILLIMCII